MQYQKYFYSQKIGSKNVILGLTYYVKILWQSWISIKLGIQLNPIIRIWMLLLLIWFSRHFWKILMHIWDFMWCLPFILMANFRKQVWSIILFTLTRLCKETLLQPLQLYFFSHTQYTWFWTTLTVYISPQSCHLSFLAENTTRGKVQYL